MKAPVDPEFISNFQGLSKALLKSLITAAKKASIERIAIVGGVIRDELIHIIHNQTIKNFNDLDLIIEGSPEIFAHQIKQLLGESRVSINRVNSNYQTIELTIDGICIDIARARLETYPHLAKNPATSNTSIENDLKRRDFTINSIAFDLKKNQLIDPCNGKDAILNRSLELNHSLSISEDPTRVIRAARYSTRLNFQLSSASLHQIEETINSWPWDWTSNKRSEAPPPALGTRFGMEVELLLEKEKWAKCLTKLQEWGALVLLDQKIQQEKYLNRKLTWASRLGVQRLTALVATAKDPCALASRLQLTQTQQNLLKTSVDLNENLDSIYKSQAYINWLPSQWCELIESHTLNPNAIAISISLGKPLWRYLLHWWGRWRHIKSKTTAQNLMKKGWSEGPELGMELKRLRDMELNKNIKLK
ncbi:CCA tRNA nucleotidyltransferase [Prochlorococcus marinus]|uniref:CCA tRNA nucleotidyltransferase n=1 Tax=Prochlorococcus marinus TaxID=1219 RepID=UPI0022B3EB22|nr:CCA tRNA nucleotidyltransferase [Prochlorococcus marinus]